jgi:hypothetical protein
MGDAVARGEGRVDDRENDTRAETDGGEGSGRRRGDGRFLRSLTGDDAGAEALHHEGADVVGVHLRHPRVG